MYGNNDTREQNWFTRACNLVLRWITFHVRPTYFLSLFIKYVFNNMFYFDFSVLIQKRMGLRYLPLDTRSHTAVS